MTGADGIFRAMDVGPDPSDPNRRLVRPEGLDPTEPPLAWEQEWLRPVYAGKSSFRRFRVQPSDEWLLLPYALETKAQAVSYQLVAPRALASRAPNVYRWLNDHRGKLESRSGTWTEEDWYGYSRRQNLERFGKPKVLVPYMIDDLCAHFDAGGHYFVNVSTGGYGVGLSPDYDVDPVYLAALLNSELLSWILRRYSRAWRGDWFGARKGNLVKLPIAVVDGALQAEIVDSYQHCQRLASDLGRRHGSRDELVERLLAAAVEAFDRSVFRLYGLTAEEVALVHSGTAHAQAAVEIA